jgi:hypothetical protein
MTALSRGTTPQPALNGHAPTRSGLDERRRGWFWHWNSIVTQYAPLIGLKGIGLLNSYTVWTDRRTDSPFHGYAFPSQEAEAAFYGEERQELITINKILVALGLVEIRKEMVVRVDAHGRRWRVPHNLYRVRDSEDGYTLTTNAVRAVLELAQRDAEVFRYIRHIFAPRFAPIDRHNPWHAILAELRPTPLWQELVQRAEATAESYRRRAARARHTTQGDGHAGPATVAGSDGGAQQVASPSTVAISNGAPDAAAGNHAPAGSVATSNRTYYQSESRNTLDDRQKTSQPVALANYQINHQLDLRTARRFEQRFDTLLGRPLELRHDPVLPPPLAVPHPHDGMCRTLQGSSPAPEQTLHTPPADTELGESEGTRRKPLALSPLLAMLRPAPGLDPAELMAALVEELAPAVRSQTPELAPEDWLLAAVIEAVDQVGADATTADVAAICRRWARLGFRTATPEGEPAGAQESQHGAQPAGQPELATGGEPLESGWLWQAVLQDVRRTVSLAVYRTWFHETVLVRQEARRLVVRAPSRLAADWLRNRGARVLQEAVERVTRQRLEVQIIAP